MKLLFSFGCLGFRIAKIEQNRSVRGIRNNLITCVFFHFSLFTVSFTSAGRKLNSYQMGIYFFQCKTFSLAPFVPCHGPTQTFNLNYIKYIFFNFLHDHLSPVVSHRLYYRQLLLIVSKVWHIVRNRSTVLWKDNTNKQNCVSSRNCTIQKVLTDIWNPHSVSKLLCCVFYELVERKKHIWSCDHYICSLRTQLTEKLYCSFMWLFLVEIIELVY